MSDRELADTSEVIVKGRLIGASELVLAPDSRRLRLGTILVEQAYKGEYQDLVYIELPSSLEPRRSIDIDYPKGRYGIWLLQGSDLGSGIFKADNPQRFWPADKGEERIRALFISPSD